MYYYDYYYRLGAWMSRGQSTFSIVSSPVVCIDR